MRPIITDLMKIELTSQEEKDENWKFREFLKKINPEKVDEIVYNLLQKIAPQIDCTACANCCKQLEVSLTEEDVDKMAKHLNLSLYQLIDQYLNEDFEAPQFIFKNQPCPFLKDNLCLEYSERPETCRSYPHLERKFFSSRLRTIINNCEVCPIVFNVFENLKDETGFCLPAF
ncbi:YkgJ family cysteine cluster protein [candidate division KSB1 bacterium]|nr:YkgJ family cysteine cluster protein [candidate division KSB1 bacterium]